MMTGEMETTELIPLLKQPAFTFRKALVSKDAEINKENNLV